MIKQLKRIFASDSEVGGRGRAGFRINSAFAHKNFLSNARLFVENPCVRRSVSVIANSVSSIKVKVYKNGKYVPIHRLYDLLNRPNGIDSWASFVESAITNYMIHGNAYMLLIDNNGLEMHNLRPDKMTIVPGEHGVPKAFEYMVDNKKTTITNDMVLPVVGHMKTVNPYDCWYGLSPLDSIRTSANLHQSITQHSLSLIQNGGRPSGVVTIRNGATPLTEQQKREIVANLVEQYQGPDNAGRIAFIDGGDFKWEPMGAMPEEMGYIKAKTLAAREISEALGVPATLIGGIGIEGESSRANFKEVLERFHEGTVLPIAQKLVSFLNNWLVPFVDADCVIKLDTANFMPLHEKRIALWHEVKDASFLTDKEKRILLGVDNIQFEAEAERVNG